DFLFAIANKFNLVSTTKLVMNFTNLIGFIGAGNIAQSLAKGFIRSGKIEPNQIYAAAPSNRNLPRFKDAMLPMIMLKYYLNFLRSNLDQWIESIFFCLFVSNHKS
ncbi:hypothetical protein SSS_07045, partial [Sarcoptes scabiei]